MIDWERLARDLEYPERDTALQEDYVRTFDLDPACTLEMGWHLYGETPERGVFLAALRADLDAAGLSEGANLPDYLPTLLRLIARRDRAAAAALARTIVPAVSSVRDELRRRQNVFAGSLEAAIVALERERQEEQP